MTEHRIQINLKVSAEMNISHSFTHLVDALTDAHELGRLDAIFVTAYNKGYGAGCVESTKESE